MSQTPQNCAGKTVVCVIFGGISTEHEISQRSADTVIKALDPQRYDVVLVGITRDGQWLRYRGDVDAIMPDQWEGHDCTPCFASPSREIHGLVELGADGTYQVTPVDVFIPCLHGRGGEDGSIQGLFELAGVPYVGCGVLASAMGMDKATTYGIVEDEAHIRCPRSRATIGEPTVEQVQAIGEELGYPFFVKPANGGSSIGISKVEAPEQIPAAIAAANACDAKLVYEEAIVGVEIGCAVMGHAGGDLVVGVPDEITLTSGFLDLHHEAKPGENVSNSTISCPPADISAEDQAKAQEAAKAIYSALGCEGFTRVDMFLTPEHEIVFNEVNTFPGMTYYSRFPRMMREAGHDVPEVMDTLIQLAMER